ncbi:hypothetical protein ABKN59_005621 [Abortiporus biennis]
MSAPDSSRQTSELVDSDIEEVIPSHSQLTQPWMTPKLNSGQSTISYEYTSPIIHASRESETLFRSRSLSHSHSVQNGLVFHPRDFDDERVQFDFTIVNITLTSTSNVSLPLQSSFSTPVTSSSTSLSRERSNSPKSQSPLHVNSTLASPPPFWQPALPVSPLPISLPSPRKEREKKKEIPVPFHLHPNGRRRIPIKDVPTTYENELGIDICASNTEGDGKVPIEIWENVCQSWSLSEDSLVTREEVEKAFREWKKKTREPRGKRRRRVESDTTRNIPEL